MLFANILLLVGKVSSISPFVNMFKGMLKNNATDSPLVLSKIIHMVTIDCAILFCVNIVITTLPYREVMTFSSSFNVSFQPDTQETRDYIVMTIVAAVVF